MGRAISNETNFIFVAHSYPIYCISYSIQYLDLSSNQISESLLNFSAFFIFKVIGSFIQSIKWKDKRR